MWIMKFTQNNTLPVISSVSADGSDLMEPGHPRAQWRPIHMYGTGITVQIKLLIKIIKLKYAQNINYNTC